MQSQFYFNIEDTSEGCYRDFISALLKKGWISCSNRSKKHDPKRFRKAIENNPYLLWTIQEKNINFAQLNPNHIVNHFEGITQLTTKIGFCEILKDMVYCCVDCFDVSPRCFNLGEPAQREEFIDDFTLSAAINILKCSTVHPTSAILQKREGILQNALFACSRFLRIKVRGEWPGVERTFKYFESFGLFGLSPQDWDSLLQLSYELSEYNYVFSISSMYEELINNYQKLTPLQIKIRLLLYSYSKLPCTQFYINGNKNIWILKAPEACRGVGMRILHTLHEILDCERGMSSRIAQKYIETPLLAPLYQPSSNSPILMKFDLRIWVLVTSFQPPLTAYIYSMVYGRRCGAAYNDRVETLNNNLIHLSNYSIQKNFTSDDTTSATSTQAVEDNATNLKNKLLQGSTSTSRSKSKSNLVQKLRSKLDVNRPPNKRNLKLSKEDLLLTHHDIIEIIEDFSGEDGEQLWSDEIWPSICCKISNILEAAAATVTHRPRSFEFLGFDILLDDRLTPWVLEVNMSPAIAHRGARHDNIIRTMAESLIDIVVDPIVTEHLKGVLKPNPDNQYASTITNTAAPDDNINHECIGEWLPLVTNSHINNNTSHINNNNNNRSNSISQNTTGTNTTINDFYTTTTTTTYNNNSNGSDVNISLLAVGKSITSNQIQFTDNCCNGFGAVLHIQKWSRKLLLRTRQFHHNRKIAVTKLQCWCRTLISKRILKCLREKFYSIIIQSIYRRFLAKKRLCFLKQRKAAISIQCRIRVFLAKKRRLRLFKIWNATKIQKFIRARNLRNRIRAMKVFLRYMRRFLSAKKYYRRKVKCIISLHYKRRARSSKIIQRAARRFLVRQHLQQIMERKCREKELARMYNEEMQQRRWEQHLSALQLEERLLMSEEEEAMRAHLDQLKKNEEMNLLMQKLLKNSKSSGSNYDINDRNNDANGSNGDNSNYINASNVGNSAVCALDGRNGVGQEADKSSLEGSLPVVDNNSINNNDEKINIINSANSEGNTSSSSRHTKRRHHRSRKHRLPPSALTSNAPPQGVVDEESFLSLNNNQPYNNNNSNHNLYENEYPPNDYFYSTTHISNTSNTMPEFTTEAWDSSVSNDLLDFIRKHDASRNRRIFKPIPTNSHSSNNLIINDFSQSKETKKHKINNSSNHHMNKSNSNSSINIQNNNTIASTNIVNNKENKKSKKSKNNHLLPRRFDNSVLDPFSSSSSDCDSLSSSTQSDNNNNNNINHSKSESLDTSKFERRRKEIKYSSKKKEVFSKSDNIDYQYSDNNASCDMNYKDSYVTAINTSYNTSDNNVNDNYIHNDSRHDKNSSCNITFTAATTAAAATAITTADNETDVRLTGLNLSEIHCTSSPRCHSDGSHTRSSSTPANASSAATSSSTGKLKKSHHSHEPTSSQAEVLFEFPHPTSQRTDSTMKRSGSRSKRSSGNSSKDTSLSKQHQRAQDRLQADTNVAPVVRADSGASSGSTGSRDIQATGDGGWERGASSPTTSTTSTALLKPNHSTLTHTVTAAASGDRTNTTGWKQAARGDVPTSQPQVAPLPAVAPTHPYPAGNTRESPPSAPPQPQDQHPHRTITSYSAEEQEQIRALERQREQQHQVLLRKRDQHRQMTEQMDTSSPPSSQQNESKKKNFLETYINSDKKPTKRPSSKSVKQSKKSSQDSSGTPVRPTTGKPSYVLHNNEIDILLSSNFDPLYKQLMNFPAVKKDTSDKNDKSEIMNDDNNDYFTPKNTNRTTANTPVALPKSTGNSRPTTDNISDRNTTTFSTPKTTAAVSESENNNRSDNINKLLKTVEDSNRKFLQSLNNNNTTATTTSNTTLFDKAAGNTGNRPISASSVRSVAPTTAATTTTDRALHLYPDRRSIIESLLTQVDQSMAQSKEAFLSVTPHTNSPPLRTRTPSPPPPYATPPACSYKHKRPDNLASKTQLLTSTGIIKSLSPQDRDISNVRSSNTMLENEAADRRNIIKSQLTQVDQSLSQSKEAFLSVTPHTNSPPLRTRTPSPPPPYAAPPASSYKRPDNLASKSQLLTSTGIIKSLSPHDRDTSNVRSSNTILENEAAAAAVKSECSRKDSINSLLKTVEDSNRKFLQSLNYNNNTGTTTSNTALFDKAVGNTGNRPISASSVRSVLSTNKNTTTANSNGKPTTSNVSNLASYPNYQTPQNDMSQQHVVDDYDIYSGVALYPTSYPSPPRLSKIHNRRHCFPTSTSRIVSTSIIKSVVPYETATTSAAINNTAYIHEASSPLLSNAFRSELIKDLLESVDESSKMRIKSHMDEYTPNSNHNWRPTTPTPVYTSTKTKEPTSAVRGLVTDIAIRKVKTVLNGLTADDITDLDWDF